MNWSDFNKAWIEITKIYENDANEGIYKNGTLYTVCLDIVSTLGMQKTIDTLDVYTQIMDGDVRITNSDRLFLESHSTEQSNITENNYFSSIGEAHTVLDLELVHPSIIHNIIWCLEKNYLQLNNEHWRTESKDKVLVEMELLNYYGLNVSGIADNGKPYWFSIYGNDDNDYTDGYSFLSAAISRMKDEYESYPNSNLNIVVCTDNDDFCQSIISASDIGLDSLNLSLE